MLSREMIRKIGILTVVLFGWFSLSTSFGFAQEEDELLQVEVPLAVDGGIPGIEVAAPDGHDRDDDDSRDRREHPHTPRPIHRREPANEEEEEEPAQHGRCDVEDREPSRCVQPESEAIAEERLEDDPLGEERRSPRDRREKRDR